MRSFADTIIIMPIVESRMRIGNSKRAKRSRTMNSDESASAAAEPRMTSAFMYLAKPSAM